MASISSLVTVFFPAVGGEPTLGAIPCLRQEWPGPGALRLLGADTDRDKAAVVDVDAFYESPSRDDPAYLDFILDICARESVNVVE